MGDLAETKRSEYGPLASYEDEDDETESRDSYPAPAYLDSLRKVSHNSIFVMLLCLTTGLLFGFLGGRSATSNLQDFGISSLNPIPREVFTERKDVPFIPHREYMGPSKEAAKNWARLTEGVCFCLPYLHSPRTRMPRMAHLV